eukprot:1160926-Pelagomonas_calceolata.AAC.3
MALTSTRHLGYEFRQGIAIHSPYPKLTVQRPLPVAGRHRQLRLHTLCQSGQQQQQQEPAPPVAPQAVDVEAVQGATEWVPASQLSSQSSAGPSVPSILAGFSGAAWLTIAAIGGFDIVGLLVQDRSGSRSVYVVMPDDCMEETSWRAERVLMAGPGPLSTAQQQPAYVAQALGVLALIIAVHEAGHFAAARLQFPNCVPDGKWGVCDELM